MKDLLHLFVEQNEAFFSLVPHETGGYMISSKRYPLDDFETLANDLLEFKKEHINLEKKMVVFFESTKFLSNESNIPNMPSFKGKGIVSKELKEIIPAINNFKDFTFFAKTKKGYLSVKSILVEHELFKAFSKLSQKLKMEIKYYFTLVIQNQRILDKKNGIILKNIFGEMYLSFTFNNVTREVSIDSKSNTSLVKVIDTLVASFMLNKTELESFSFIFVTTDTEGTEAFDLPSEYNWSCVSFDNYLKTSTKNIFSLKALKL